MAHGRCVLEHYRPFHEHSEPFDPVNLSICQVVFMPEPVLIPCPMSPLTAHLAALVPPPGSAKSEAKAARNDLAEKGPLETPGPSCAHKSTYLEIVGNLASPVRKRRYLDLHHHRSGASELTMTAAKLNRQVANVDRALRGRGGTGLRAALTVRSS